MDHPTTPYNTRGATGIRLGVARGNNTCVLSSETQRRNYDIYIFYQDHAVSRTQQGRQREPIVETLRSPLSAEFWRHCLMSGRTQRRVIINISNKIWHHILLPSIKYF